MRAFSEWWDTPEATPWLEWAYPEDDLRRYLRR